MTNSLDGLQSWYAERCDGEWEHTYGVELSTLDNPGWRVEVHVEGTNLAGRAFERLVVERSEHDWLHCWVGVPERPNQTGVKARGFNAACGPGNLEEALQVFLDWAVA